MTWKKILTPLGLGMALVVVLAGSAGAAAATLVLGRAQTATAVTTLTNKNGTALSLAGGRGAPALAVNNTAKVSRLNSDLLDGLDSAALQRTVAASCPAGSAIRKISQTGVACDATLLGFDAVEVVAVDGLASTACPFAGGISVAGGYVLPEGVVAFASASTVFSDDESEEYVVRLHNLDGSRYNGPVLLTIQCSYAGEAPASGRFLRADDGKDIDVR